MPGTDGRGPGKAILYARVSTEEQARSGYSLAQQLDALRAYAAREGYEVLEEVVDAGQSGASMERPGMYRVRELVAAGGVSVVLAQDRDRFAREPAYHYLLRREFEEYGTRIRALDDRGDDTAEGELMNGILDQLAKFERAKTAERTRRGRLRKAKEGKIVASRVPNFGFSYTTGRDSYAVDEEKMAVVRRILRLIGPEGVPIYGVARILDAEGVPAPSGGSRWSTKVIRGMVLDDVYAPHDRADLDALVAEGLLAPEVAARAETPCGIWWFNRRSVRITQVSEAGPGGRTYRKRSTVSPKDRGEWVAVPVPASGVPRGWVDVARENIKDNRRISVSGERVWELSGGVMYCSSCGRRMATHSTAYRRKRSGKTVRVHYYRCQQALRYGDACPQRKNLRAEATEEAIWGFVCGLMTEPARLRTALDAMIEGEREAMRGDPEREPKVWLDKIASVDRQRSRAQDLAIEGLIGPDELREKLARLAETREATEKELAVLEGRRERLAELGRDRDALVEAYAAIAPAALDALDHEERHAVYKLLRLRVVARPDGALEASGVFRGGGGIGKSGPIPRKPNRPSRQTCRL